MYSYNLAQFGRTLGSKDKQKRKSRLGLIAGGVLGTGALGAGAYGIKRNKNKPTLKEKLLAKVSR